MTDDDGYRWLEDVASESALAWVAERNAETTARYMNSREFRELAEDLLRVLEAADRIPYTSRTGVYRYNLWRDTQHVRGLWRRTTQEQYRKDAPDWETLLSLDVLARAEDVDWVWKGARVRRPDQQRALVRLSRGGADAVEVREFDLATRTFTAGGFRVPEAKTTIGWAGADTVLVATPAGGGSLTASGYPRTVRRWKRGTALEHAPVVFEGAPTDVSAWGWHDSTPGYERDFVAHSRDFYRKERYVLTAEDTLVRIDIPDDSRMTIERDHLLVTLMSDWLGHPAGSLITFGFDAFLAGDRTARALFTPDEHTALAGHAWTRHHLLLTTMHDVSTRIEALTPTADGPWTRTSLTDVPPLSDATVVNTDPDTDDTYDLHVQGYLQPPTLSEGRIAEMSQVLRRAPHRFPTTGLSVRRHFATSRDGTRVPYFVTGPDHETHDPAPTVLHGYGGFRAALTPAYEPTTGIAWLQDGNTRVVANIRGGGEYGPAWHQSALRADRSRAFEDFAAVAEDLVARGITSPAMLGAHGRSNGGLLMGAMLTRYPHLFGAIAAEVPLLDMLRYHQLLAGASWTAEYGDPGTAADRPHLRTLSPYHQLTTDASYPPLLLRTSSRDDRVHPGHARKFAARIRDLGHTVYLYESPGGGHGGGHNTQQTALNKALLYHFFREHLTG